MQTPDIGSAMREDRARIDFGALRKARRQRVFDAMERLGLDACLFGREGNARYVAGQRRLWTSNTRAFLPTCVAVRATQRVHVMSLSASIDDAPEDIPAGDVYGRSFDPSALVEIYAALPGLRDARRVGVDGLSVPMRALIGHVCSHAQIVGAEEMMRELRRTKLPAEIDCLRVAIAITESALQRAADALRPGVTGRHLRALYLERMCTLGTSTFAEQGTFCVAKPGRHPPSFLSDEPFANGDLVIVSGGALWAGYEGSLARTRWCGDGGAPSRRQRALHARGQSLMNHLVEQCRPGRSGADLTRAYETAGESLPSGPVAHGVGLGHEGPIAGSGSGAGLDRRQVLATDMVVTLRAWITDGEEGFLGEEVVRIGADAPEVLTTMSYGALARSRGGDS